MSFISGSIVIRTSTAQMISIDAKNISQQMKCTCFVKSQSFYNILSQCPPHVHRVVQLNTAFIHLYFLGNRVHFY